MPASASNPPASGPVVPSEWPGERLGLPREGPGSIGRPGRRIGALAIDWALVSVASFLFYDYDGLATMLIFIALQILFIPTIGGGIGHRLVGLRVVLLGGGWPGLWRPILRTVLLALAIPALVWDSDQRGFHDKAAGTVLIRA